MLKRLALMTALATVAIAAPALACDDSCNPGNGGGCPGGQIACPGDGGNGGNGGGSCPGDQLACPGDGDGNGGGSCPGDQLA